MTVSSLTNRVDYTGNSVLTTYAYTFRIFAATDLLVYVAGTLQTLNAQYTVTGVGNVGGGNVVFTVAPGAVTISIVRSVAITQLVDYVANDSFPAETHEGALDRLTMICQQISEIFGRAIKFASSSLSKNIDVADLTASKYLQVDPTGTKIIMGDMVVPGAIPLPLSVLNGGTGLTTLADLKTALGIEDPALVYDLVNQVASIGRLTLTSVPVAGIYKISAYLETTTVGSGGTVTVTFFWTDEAASRTQTCNTVSLASAAFGGFGSSQTQPVLEVYSAAGQTIDYSAAVAGATGSPKYALHMRVERVG